MSAALERWWPGWAVHDPGKIITDVAVALALGGDCLADIALLRAEPELFGPVASDPWCRGWSSGWPRTRRGRRGRSEALPGCVSYLPDSC